jgi:FkbM family methyltransferase
MNNIKEFYAEFGTDKIIRENYFSDFNYKGLIVEVGGADPEFLSMSKHFKDSGWRSIIVEPNPEFANRHRNLKNEIYEFACSFEDGESEFTIVQQQVSAYDGIITHESFSSLSVNEDFLNFTNFKLTESNSTKIKVKTIKLNTLFEKLDLKNIDILSIDTEGWELEVMKGFDTKKYNCKIIVVENFLNNPNYEKYFNDIGYSLNKQIEYNQIYIKNDLLLSI